MVRIKILLKERASFSYINATPASVTKSVFLRDSSSPDSLIYFLSDYGKHFDV